MSFDIFDPPEHPEEAEGSLTSAEIATLEEEVRSLTEYLREMNSSLFSVQELQKLLNPPATFGVGGVAGLVEYKAWLLRTKRRADAGILGGRHVW